MVVIAVLQVSDVSGYSMLAFRKRRKGHF